MNSREQLISQLNAKETGRLRDKDIPHHLHNPDFSLFPSATKHMYSTGAVN